MDHFGTDDESCCPSARVVPSSFGEMMKGGLVSATMSIRQSDGTFDGKNIILWPRPSTPTPAHRSLIAFAAWSSFAHAVVMSTLGFEMATERTGFLGGSAVLVVIGVALIALAPKQAEQASASAA